MLISLNWLKQYVDIKESIDEIANALTMIGQEVEAIDIQGKDLNNVVIGQIVEFDKHPNSDRLTLLKVNVGEGEPLQIICGAKNHKLNDKVVVAKIGAVLPGNFKIKKSKIRDIESYGMLCSEAELGFAKESEGIIILPEDAPIGKEYREYMGLNDVIFELEITPNRPDCLSHIGIARELGAYYNKEVNYPSTEINGETGEKTEDNIKVEIENSDLSKRYVARIIRNVTVKESPAWLKERVESIGIRSINNIVDASNFVMMEMNQPNHTFDFDKIAGGKISVRSAGEDEKLITLDEEERDLAADDIVISDAEKVVALGGVMGGQNSQITENTKNILLEVAHFNPINIRRTSRRLALISDSSYRFERRVDRSNAINVINRLANLIQEVAGGEILAGAVDIYPEPYARRVATLSFEKLHRFVGKVIPKEEVIRILTKLEVEVKDNGDSLTLTAPTYRDDLENEQDYFEEVIRMYGFDNIENILPRLDINPKATMDTTKLYDKVKVIASQAGLKEVINYSFVPRDAMDKIKFTKVPRENLIDLPRPITEDFATLRPTLIYSLLKNAKDNMNKNVSNIRFFEVSRTFEKGEELASEETKLAFILAGENDKTLWNAKPVPYDFYDLKGIVQEIFTKLGFKNYQIKRSAATELHPGRSADVFVGRELIGSFGEIHPDVLENFDLNKKAVLVAEFSIDLIKKYIGRKTVYEPLVKFPAVPRDFAFVVKEDVLVGDILKAIEKVDKKIEKVELFDIYRGVGVLPGMKSVAISVILRDKNKTLEEKEIVEISNKIVNKVKKDFDGILRQ